MATVADRLAALEAAVFGVPPVEATPEPLPVVATYTKGDKEITATEGTEADLRALVESKEPK